MAAGRSGGRLSRLGFPWSRPAGARGAPGVPDEGGSVTLPFSDRDAAGRQLARRLAGAGLPADTLVLGIPRGGVPVAAAVARELGLELDVLAAHKVGAPFNPEFAVGAVTADGTTLTEPWALDEPDVTEAFLERESRVEIARAREREERLRRGRSAASLAGRTVVLIDDGVATGATVHAAVLAARARGAVRVVVATPVAAAESLRRLGTIADEAIALATPEPFIAVGLWYESFEQVGDASLAEILETGGAGTAGARGAGDATEDDDGTGARGGPA